jgi:hypothetical protein
MPITESDITEVSYHIEVLTSQSYFNAYDERLKGRTTHFTTRSQAMKQYEKFCEEYPDAIFRVMETETVTSIREVTSSRD